MSIVIAKKTKCNECLLPVLRPSFLTVRRIAGSPQSHTEGLLQYRGREEGRGREGGREGGREEEGGREGGREEGGRSAGSSVFWGDVYTSYSTV